MELEVFTVERSKRSEGCETLAEDVHRRQGRNKLQEEQLHRLF